MIAAELQLLRNNAALQNMHWPRADVTRGVFLNLMYGKLPKELRCIGDAHGAGGIKLKDVKISVEQNERSFIVFHRGKIAEEIFVAMKHLFFIRPINILEPSS